MMYFIDRNGQKWTQYALFNFFTEGGFTREEFNEELRETEGYITIRGQDYCVADLVIKFGGQEYNEMYWARVDQLCGKCTSGYWEKWFERCVDEDGNEVEDYPL